MTSESEPKGSLTRRDFLKFSGLTAAGAAAGASTSALAGGGGKFVAHVVASRVNGRDPGQWQSPQTICYSMVNADPKEAIIVDAHYA